MSAKQNTLGGSITFSGKGLHTGKQVTMTANPAPENHGIVFRRVDIEGAPMVPALCDYVVDTSRGTTIAKGEARVSTIEHIMSALWTLGVDNALIDIDAPETPIMDGSAREYAAEILRVGVVEQSAQRRYYEVTEKQVYAIPEKGVMLAIYPSDEYTASVHIDFNSKIIGNQYATFTPEDNYSEKIAPNRTFVFLHEIEALAAMGLVKGGDVDNAIVIVENPVTDEQLERLSLLFNKKDIRVTGGYLNNLELRASNEMARHKLLDLLGDFALLGMRIKGSVMATRPGHYANTEFMKQLRASIRREGVKPRFKYDARKAPLYDINDIKRMLPHRAPFLLVDRVYHLDEYSVAGIKQVTFNEPFFQGHFPNEPIMPGVLIVEAMAQCSGIYVMSKVDNPEEYSTYFLRIDNVRFRQKVVPGDTMQIECEIVSPSSRKISQVECKVFVGDTLACEATLLLQIVKNK
ncbi:MAG: bifunctional UDP-3-O-[3-hydroxymyristoyl] N-acetylglucosamine deacetylase/3-hydroxyacyl-ACP dehydratase [Alistipes sp.]|nr:bifunctional UDP-3-O-[3-hydroxymyristoyl] N-acetylglucosamine deacetylase/3-hydroxyacyl-ACP dehydratase [Alistipes sp.]